MKAGFRKPSFSKSIRARTTGRLKRNLKRSMIPGYRGYYRSTNSIFDKSGKHVSMLDNPRYQCKFKDMSIFTKISFIIDSIIAFLYGLLCFMGICLIGYVMYLLFFN